MNRRNGTRHFARNLVIVATALGLWGALVLLFAAPLALTDPPVSWRQAIAFGVSIWALWILFLPAVAWLAFRYPIERRRLLRHLGLHLVACLLVVGASRATFGSENPVRPLPQQPEAPGRSPGARAARLGPPGAFNTLMGFRAALDVLVYWSLVGVCQAITNFRGSQVRERRAAELEARLARAQLQTLRMQINPHFLFNTLNSITALVYMNPRAADEMLGDLSELLRRSLDSMNEQEVSLAQELEFVGGYLRIEKKRFGDRLQVDQRVPEELRNALVPALILQPLVENAIRHGIEPRRGPGMILIEASREAQHLRLVVQDNGRGLLGAEGGSTARRGIGLANTEARLRGLYGQDQRFSFGNAEPQGCRVEIHLPFHLEPLPVPSVPDQPVA
ncbi:MAG: histidine kinase [Verrucomicrobiales bacterium]|nr:histidine kinase [Verrucomicrobiales bacterium]